MFVMKVMPHGRGVYHLPQASSSFVPHDCGVLRLALFPLESASRFKQLLYVNPAYGDEPIILNYTILFYIKM